jgi:phthalate 4,5-dioxygenase oxygenase subunit
MGAIQDRTRENLVSTDNGIIMARHKLMKAIRALADKGVQPPGTDPASQRVRSAALLAPKDVNFFDAAKDVLKIRDDQLHSTV